MTANKPTRCSYCQHVQCCCDSRTLLRYLIKQLREENARLKIEAAKLRTRLVALGEKL